MELKKLKNKIVEWAIQNDISSSDFKWVDNFRGMIDDSKGFVSFSIENTAMLLSDLQSLKECTNAIYISVIASNNKLEIMVCYEAS